VEVDSMSARTELRGFPRFSLAVGSLALALASACGGSGDAQEALGHAEQHLSTGVVISAFYGGGGNTGAAWQNDFVELFNRGASDVTLTGWSLQYASASGATWNVLNVDTVTLHAGQHFLIQLASGGLGGSALPVTADQTSTALDLAAKAGKIALVDSTTKLTCGSGCASDGSVVDLVGYGTATDFETAAAPATDALSAGVRGGGGCTETDDNSADFTASTSPTIEGQTSAASPCGSGPVDAGKTDTGSPVDGGKPSDSGAADAAKPASGTHGPDLSPAGTCASTGGRPSSGRGAVSAAGLVLAFAALRARRRR
jgi:hypothetical protein